MSLNKLTQRARAVLQELSALNPGTTSPIVKCGDVVAYITNTSGLGAVLIQSFPKLKINRKAEINLNQLVTEAYHQASKMDHSYVGTEHFFLALLKLTSSTDFEKVKKHLLGMNIFPRALSFINERKDNVILSTYSQNLNKQMLRSASDPLVMRAELDKLTSILLKKDNANVLLVGEPGVGKTSLINLLVSSINNLDIPALLAGYSVVEFDLMSYLTGIANKGSIDQSLLFLQEELKGLKRTILVLKNFQNLFISTNSGVGVPILLPIFKDILETTDINFIASVNTAVYEKIMMDNSHMLDTFTMLEIPEPPEKEVKDMLRIKAKSLGEFHNINVSDNVIDHIYKTAKSNEMNTHFPRKAIELLDLACAHLLVRKNRVPKDYKNLVDKTVVIMDKIDKSIDKGAYESAIRFQTKLNDLEVTLTAFEDNMVYADPIKLSKKDVNIALESMNFTLVDEPIDSKYLSNLATKMKERIIGQNFAVESVVKALIRSKLGLRAKNRPIGSFLFLGPTGVGKTELAKVLASLAFGQVKDNHLIRLDMSDFSEKHTVARLIGSPPGYVGYNEGGELTSKISLQPESVVLFDEIEKAHPDVLNILLQITEEGELADAKGNTFDFSKAIIVLTSNLGTEILHNKEIGFRENIKIADDAVVEKHLKENLKKILRPELLNRFDEVVVFRRLTKEDQMQVLELFITEVDKRLKEQDVYLKVNSKTKEYLLKVGYSQEYGARSLRRTVEKELLDKIAEILLKHKSRPLLLKASTVGNKLSVVVKK